MPTAVPPPPRQVAARPAAPERPDRHNSSVEAFMHRFSALSDASVGIYTVRTKESARVVGALRKWAFTRQKDFREWDHLSGWTHIAPSLDTPKAFVKMPDPATALKRIMDLDGDGKNAWEGVFVMHWPHFFIGGPGNKPHPLMLGCIRNYAASFIGNPLRRLILLMPEGTQLPMEIVHDVAVLDLELPTRLELRNSYDALATRRVRDDKGRETSVSLNFNNSEIEQFVNIGAGMTQVEFETALALSMVENRDTFPDIPVRAFSKILSDAKVAVLKQSEVLELISTDVNMSDVGGMKNLKNWLRERRASLTPEGKAAGLDPVKGFVALGPPGTGKSLVAKATADELGLPLIRLNISAVFGSLIGESEKRLRNALALLKAIGRCVVWIDEVDKSGMNANQQSGDGGVGKRVFGAMLTFMDDNTGNLFWVATGNWPHLVDPAFARKGRFDDVFAVLPPHTIEREEILKIHLRKRKRLVEGMDFSESVIASEGFVPAEIEAAVKEAILHTYNHGVELTDALIAKQFGNFKKLSVAFPDEFAKMNDWAEKNARPASEPPVRHRPAAPAPPTSDGTREVAI